MSAVRMEIEARRERSFRCRSRGRSHPLSSVKIYASSGTWIERQLHANAETHVNSEHHMKTLELVTTVKPTLFKSTFPLRYVLLAKSRGLLPIISRSTMTVRHQTPTTRKSQRVRTTKKSDKILPSVRVNAQNTNYSLENKSKSKRRRNI